MDAEFCRRLRSHPGQDSHQGKDIRTRDIRAKLPLGPQLCSRLEDMSIAFAEYLALF